MSATAENAVYTDDDRAVAQQLLEIVSRRKAVPEEAMIRRLWQPFGEIPLYRPLQSDGRVELVVDDDRRSELLCWVYPSLIEGDRDVAVPVHLKVEFDEYGRWQYRHMPMISEELFRRMRGLLRSYSTFRKRCTVGDHPMQSLEASKVRALVMGKWLPPAAEPQGGLQPMLLPHRCPLHWVFQSAEEVLFSEYDKANLEEVLDQLDDLELADYLGPFFSQLVREIRQRNRRATRRGTAHMLRAFYESREGSDVSTD